MLGFCSFFQWATGVGCNLPLISCACGSGLWLQILSFLGHPVSSMLRTWCPVGGEDLDADGVSPTIACRWQCCFGSSVPKKKNLVGKPSACGDNSLSTLWWRQKATGLPNTKNPEGPPSLHTPSAEKEKTSGYRTHRGSPRLNWQPGSLPGTDPGTAYVWQLYGLVFLYSS